MNIFRRRERPESTRATRRAHVSWWHVVNSIFIAVSLTGFGVGVYLICQSTFSVISQGDTILIVPPHTRVEVIDFTRFEKITMLWNQKISAPEPMIRRDPFFAPPSAAPAPPSTSTPATS